MDRSVLSKKAAGSGSSASLITLRMLAAGDHGAPISRSTSQTACGPDCGGRARNSQISPDQ